MSNWLNVLKMEHVQTVLTQMRRRKTLRLIRVCTVCQDEHTFGNGRLQNLYIIRLSSTLH